MSKNKVKYPCDGCTVSHPDSEICSSYYKCSAYIEWFNSEWKEIREAAEVIKNREKRK